MTERKMRAAERRLREAHDLLAEALENIEASGGFMRYGSMELARAADKANESLREIQYARERIAYGRKG
jgi:hypothetical protein